jgi:hypothetical protein
MRKRWWLGFWTVGRMGKKFHRPTILIKILDSDVIDGCKLKLSLHLKNPDFQTEVQALRIE